MPVESHQPPTELEGYYHSIVNEFGRGRVIPFLGAGINLYERPENVEWYKQFLPSGSELAEYLAGVFRWCEPETSRDLQRVCQMAEVMDGPGPLYDELHTLFSRDYPSASVHDFLAKLPSLLRSKGYARGLPLIITTNYDDVLEETFRRNGTPFDIVTYVGSVSGKFLHLPEAEKYTVADYAALDGAWRVVRPLNRYPFPLKDRTVILKIHGSVARSTADRCSFVITEDDYIEYLAQMDFSNPLPQLLASEMCGARFLYMGYGLRDWNLRVILKRISGGQSRSSKSWAIQKHPSRIEQRFWATREVNIVEVELRDFVPELERQIQAMPGVAAAPSVAA